MSFNNNNNNDERKYIELSEEKDQEINNLLKIIEKPRNNQHCCWTPLCLQIIIMGTFTSLCSINLIQNYSPSSKPQATKPPTHNPSTAVPTKKPIKLPTNNPTLSPTTKPPTHSPITAVPTKKPIKLPTNSPTLSPTTKPPTHSPTHTTVVPTKKPIKLPTNSPTLSPTVFNHMVKFYAECIDSQITCDISSLFVQLDHQTITLIDILANNGTQSNAGKITISNNDNTYHYTSHGVYPTDIAIDPQTIGSISFDCKTTWQMQPITMTLANNELINIDCIVNGVNNNGLSINNNLTAINAIKDDFNVIDDFNVMGDFFNLAKTSLVIIVLATLINCIINKLSSKSSPKTSIALNNAPNTRLFPPVNNNKSDDTNDLNNMRLTIE